MQYPSEDGCAREMSTVQLVDHLRTFNRRAFNSKTGHSVNYHAVRSSMNSAVVAGYYTNKPSIQRSTCLRDLMHAVAAERTTQRYESW